MRAAILNIFSFLTILLGTMFFLEADVLNRYPDTPIVQQPDKLGRGNSFFQEGLTSQTQNALLHSNELEEFLHEQGRSSFKVGGLACGANWFSLIVVSLYNEKLNSDYFYSFTSNVPIYLKVLSIRL